MIFNDFIEISSEISFARSNSTSKLNYVLLKWFSLIKFYYFILNVLYFITNLYFKDHRKEKNINDVKKKKMLQLFFVGA